MIKAIATVDTNVPAKAYVQMAPMLRTNLHRVTVTSECCTEHAESEHIQPFRRSATSP